MLTFTAAAGACGGTASDAGATTPDPDAVTLAGAAALAGATALADVGAEALPGNAS